MSDKPPILNTPVPIPISSHDLGFPHNHGQISWEHFLAQHIGKQHTEDFVTAFYPPLKILDQVLEELYIKRWAEVAVGSALDGVGSIVGAYRHIPEELSIKFFGFASQAVATGFNQARMRLYGEPYQRSDLPDVEFRKYIYIKIMLNNGHGTAEEIVYAVKKVFDLTSNVYIIDTGNANARMFIGRWFSSPDDPVLRILQATVPRAAGVKLWFVRTDPRYIFGFANLPITYYGFGIGVMASLM
jgi:hypothetical protein